MSRRGPNTRMPVVGVTANRLVEDSVHRDWLRRRYIDALERHAGVATVILPTCGNERAACIDSLARLDGLLLTGDESNLEPAIFRGESHTRNEYSRDRRDLYRDRLSATALQAALDLKMPVFGICRGLQEMNVYFGGTLHDNLETISSKLDHAEDTSLPRDDQYEPVHDVALPESAWLRQLLGTGNIKVNSLHRQGIEKPGRGLVAEAIAPDGLIEAIRVEASQTFQLAVQWHPEWHVQKDFASQTLFKAFGEACGAYRAASGH